MSSPADSLDDHVIDLLRSASYEEATGTLIARWRDYLPEHPDHLADRIHALPEEWWDAEPMLVYALACTALVPRTSNPFAAIAYFDAAESAADRHPDLTVLCPLGRARALRALGLFVDAKAQAALARERLAGPGVGVRTRLELEARILFEEGACLALTGDLDAAARAVQHGLGLADEQNVPTEAEARGWLQVAEYFGGAPVSDDVVGAGTSAPALLAATMAAVDEGRLDDAARATDELESIAARTEFAAFVLVLRSVIAGARQGPLEQLELLQAAQLASHDWQSPALIRSMHDMERACALVQLGSAAAARDAVAEQANSSPMHARHAHCPARAIARLALHAGDFEGVLAATAPCRAMGDRHAPRSLAWVEVLQAAAHDALGDAATSAEIFDRSLLHAARTGWRRQFTSLPPARLASLLSAAGDRPQPPVATAVLEHLEARLEPESEETLAPLSTRERLILGKLVAGQSRQEMSSELRVSPNTIKAQVRSIYRKLGASNRHEAINRAAQYGIAL